MRRRSQNVGLALGCLAFAAAWMAPGLDARAASALAVAALMALWWASEALPIQVTACVPLLFFPLAPPFELQRLATLGRTAAVYVDAYVFLFLGGMCIAAAIEACGLHRRIALGIVARVGTSPARVLLGVLVSTASVSLWISNTATAAMMVPIAVALARTVEERAAGGPPRRYGTALLLAVAYGANVGGIGTKIGTAPNAQFAGFLESRGQSISFLEFMVVGLGFALLFLPVVWGVLWLGARRDGGRVRLERADVLRELEGLGRLSRAEQLVLAVFALAVAGWVAGRPLAEALSGSVLGELRTAHVEGGVAMLAALLLACLRVRGKPLLDGQALRGISWPTLLLLGGSLALAEGVAGSGLSALAAGRLGAIGTLPALAQTLLASAAAVGISAFASNTATIAVLLPVLGAARLGTHEPVVLFAATMACSCDFALPAGTPPNALVFGTGRVRMAAMLRAGLVLDCLAAIVVALWAELSVRWVL